MRLETGTSSASLKTPGLQRKKQHELSISSLFPRSGPYQGHRHGRQLLLSSSATCHTVGDSTDSCPEFQSLNSHNSPHEPPTLNPPPALCTARIYLPYQKFSHHLCAYTLIHKCCKVQQHPTVFQPTHLPTLQRLES